MRFEELLRIVGDEPVFETGLLLSGAVDPGGVRRQLSRWVTDGRLYQLRRGLYALAPPYQKVRPHSFLVANRMVRGSYVSLQSALAFRGLIPEHVPVTISVAIGRGGRWDTPLGLFEYHHVQPRLFGGYVLEAVGAEQEAFVATPAKALEDLVHLVPGADDPAYLAALRLQHLEGIDWGAAGADKPKIRRAFRRLAALARAESTP